MSPKDDEEDTSSWKPPGRELRADGRMTGDQPIAKAPPPPEQPPETTRDGLPTLDALTTGELHLDQPIAPRPSTYVEPGPYRPLPRPNRPWGLFAALLALGVGALALFALRPGLQHSLPVPSPTHGTVLIFSDPDGASVIIGDKVVGVTPFAADNTWQGEVTFELQAPGRQTKRGTFTGGRDAQVKLVLPRLKSK